MEQQKPITWIRKQYPDKSENELQKIEKNWRDYEQVVKDIITIHLQDEDALTKRHTHASV